MTSRIGVAVLGLLIAMYAGYSWYYWPQLLPDENLTGWQALLTPAFIGAVVLFVGIGLLSVWGALVKPRTSDYLIDMDAELRKVVWPTVQPLFDPKTEAWGSTYVVIGCTLLLTMFVFAVDKLFDLVITNGLLPWLYS